MHLLDGERAIKAADYAMLAKWKTTVQMLALIFIFLAPLLPGAGLVAVLLLWLAGILTVVTGAQYFMGAWPYLSGEKSA